MIESDAVTIRLISDFLNTTKASAHIKDINTGKYVDSNQINVKKFGLDKAEEIIGATIWDLNKFMQPFWGNTLANEIEKLELSVISTQQAMTEKRTFLAKTGKIWVHDMTKIPVLNNKGKVCGIFTLSENITHTYGLIELWKMYRSSYRVKKIALTNYLGNTPIFKLT